MAIDGKHKIDKRFLVSQNNMKKFTTDVVDEVRPAHVQTLLSLNN